MSGVVEEEERRREEAEFRDFLIQLVETGDLRGTDAEGIAKLVIDRGVGVLSSKQSFVFNRDVVRPYSAECDECNDRIPWAEAYEFHHSPGRCSACQARFEKYMSE